MREDLQGGLRTPIQGWFGQRLQFEMGRDYDPEPGVAGFHPRNAERARPGGDRGGGGLVGEAGLGRLRTKTEALTAYLLELHDAWLAPLGFELGSPRDAARRGGHVSVRHDEAWPICRVLIGAPT